MLRMHFYKETDKYWRINTAIGLDSSIYLHAVDLTIQLQDLYQRVANLKGVQTTMRFDEKDLKEF